MEHGADLGFAQVLFLVLGDSWGVEPGGVDQLDFPVFVQYFRGERIPGGMWHIRDHKLFFFEQFINKRGLADIGPANKTDLDRMLHSQVFDIDPPSGCREGFFRAHEMIFIIFVVEFLIFFRIGIETAEVAFPVFDADAF